MFHERNIIIDPNKPMVIYLSRPIRPSAKELPQRPFKLGHEGMLLGAMP